MPEAETTKARNDDRLRALDDKTLRGQIAKREEDAKDAASALDRAYYKKDPEVYAKAEASFKARDAEFRAAVTESNRRIAERLAARGQPEKGKDRQVEYENER